MSAGSVENAEVRKPEDQAASTSREEDNVVVKKVQKEESDVAKKVQVHRRRSRREKKKVNVDAQCYTTDEFRNVRAAFMQNFTGRWEHQGAALAVYHMEKLVVDVWCGDADRANRVPWTKSTYANILCCTKSVAAICVAMKVDRGECSYSDKVTKFWPEFGQNNKEDITIDMILTHRAGLPTFDGMFVVNEMSDDRFSRMIEDQFPKYPPGSKTEYHALTFGWLIDEIFRRIDKSHRTVREFFHEEVQKKYDVELYIGSTPEQVKQIAKYPVAKKGALRDYIHDRKILTIGNHVKRKSLRSDVTRYKAKNEVAEVFNDSEVRSIGQAGLSGVATARGLAKTFQLFMNGTLVSKDLIKTISTPEYENEFDHALGEEENKGYGFIYTKSAKGSWQIGHPAIGGQCVYMDPTNHLIVCYLTNDLKNWVGDRPLSFSNLQHAVYDVLTKAEKESVAAELPQHSLE